MKSLKLLSAELLKVTADIKAYWFNYIFGNLNVLFLFVGLFYAFSNSYDSPEGMFQFLFGLMLWYFGVHAIDLIALIVEEEILEGTLEQILMTKTAVINTLTYRIIAQIIFDTFKAVIMFVLCFLMFKIPLSIFLEVHWISVIVIFFITLTGLYGIGYIIAGLSLLYKKVSAVASLSSNLILYFSGIIIPLHKLPNIFFNIFANILPLKWGMKTLRFLMENNYDIGVTVINQNFVMLTGISLIWILTGLFLFTLLKNSAIKKGNLGQY